MRGIVVLFLLTATLWAQDGPVITTTQERFVHPDAPIGTLVGNPIEVDSPAGTLRWFIFGEESSADEAGTDLGYFSVDQQGQIRVAQDLSHLRNSNRALEGIILTLAVEDADRVIGEPQNVFIWVTERPESRGIDVLTLVDDANLRTCLQNWTGLSATLAAASAVTLVNCFCDGINDLDGIQFWSQLEVLDLGNNLITDPRRLGTMIEMIDLRLSGNMISDLETNHPLAFLVALERLDLSYNQIRSSNAFGNLPELSFISLNHNELCEVESLAANAGLAAGDVVLLDDNFLTSQEAITQIGTIQARGAALVSFDDQNVGSCATVPPPKTLPKWPEENVLVFSDIIGFRAPCTQPPPGP